MAIGFVSLGITRKLLRCSLKFLFSFLDSTDADTIPVASENILPMPCPFAVMRSALMRYFLTNKFMTALARAWAIRSLTSMLPSGDAYPFTTTLALLCLFR